jgi:hypothetical protein
VGSENACHRKRPEYTNHIWSYDSLSERLKNGRLVKRLGGLDEFTREGFRNTHVKTTQKLLYMVAHNSGAGQIRTHVDTGCQ